MHHKIPQIYNLFNFGTPDLAVRACALEHTHTLAHERNCTFQLYTCCVSTCVCVCASVHVCRVSLYKMGADVNGIEIETTTTAATNFTSVSTGERRATREEGDTRGNATTSMTTWLFDTETNSV